MTDEQIIEMAKKSGISIANVPNLAFGRLESGVELLKTFAKLVARHELEVCATFIEKLNLTGYKELAELIRARGEE